METEEIKSIAIWVLTLAVIIESLLLIYIHCFIIQKMVIFPSEYLKEEKIVKLTKSEIDKIIDELERTEHNIFVFLHYDKLIKKLKKFRDRKKQN